MVDLSNPDVNKFPLYFNNRVNVEEEEEEEGEKKEEEREMLWKIKPLIIDLNPGDVMYLPPMWFHEGKFFYISRSM